MLEIRHRMLTAFKTPTILSFQIHHIKQWGTTIHIYPLRWQPNRPCQQAQSSTTDIGITQQTPNKPKIYPTAPKQQDNKGIDGQQFHYYTCTYNTNYVLKLEK